MATGLELRKTRRERALALMCAALLAATACGSRRSQQDLAAGAGGRLSSKVEAEAGAPVPIGSQAPEPGGQPSVSVPAGEADPGGTAPEPSAPGVASGSALSTGGGQSRSPSSREGGAPEGRIAAAPSGGPTAPARAGAPAAPQSAPAPAPKAATKTPIKVGSVGTMSGPIGETFKGNMTAVQIWARWINSKGGLNGHPLAVSTVDDGSDPARHRAALQDLVEKTGVVAFVGNVSVFGMQQGSIDYLTGKRIPLVGGDRLNESWYSSPMLFPQASAGTAILWTQMVDVAVTVGKGAKVGFISCQELQMCRDALKHWPGYARQNGLDPVYSAQVSLTQPNFTAECLAAQRAGVKVLQVGMDNNSTRRIASNCAQQGFKPVFSLVGASLDMPNEPGLDQALFTSEVFPWVADDTPAVQEFRQVMAAQAPNLPLSFDLASGWVAAKLFEKAATRVGDNPTSAEVLEGLWAVQGDNLGGLTGPLTFARDQKAPPLFCLWVMRIEAKRWAAPQGSRAVCQPRP